MNKHKVKRINTLSEIGESAQTCISTSQFKSNAERGFATCTFGNKYLLHVKLLIILFMFQSVWFQQYIFEHVQIHNCLLLSTGMNYHTETD